MRFAGRQRRLTSALVGGKMNGVGCLHRLRARFQHLRATRHHMAAASKDWPVGYCHTLPSTQNSHMQCFELRPAFRISKAASLEQLGRAVYRSRLQETVAHVDV